MTEKENVETEQELQGDGLGDATGAADAAASENDGLTRAHAEIAELKDRIARSQAEFENYRRRVQREKEDLAVFSNQRLVLNLLPVLDNLERALATGQAAGDEKLRQGVEMTARSFRDILAKEGVVPIEALGHEFDPKLHEAVMTVENEAEADGVITMEFTKGYKLGDRVIRPSMVQVNKRG